MIRYKLTAIATWHAIFYFTLWFWFGVALLIF